MTSRRRSRTPVIVAPVVAPARFAVKRSRRRQAEAKKKSTTTQQQDRIIAGVTKQLRQEYAIVAPGTKKAKQKLDAGQMSERALELAKMSSWRYRNRKWLAVLPWAALLGVSRGMAHVTPVDGAIVALIDVGLVSLALFLALLGKEPRKVAGGLLILAVFVAGASSPYLPLFGFFVLAWLLVFAGIWFFKVSRTPIQECKAKLVSLNEVRPRGVIKKFRKERRARAPLRLLMPVLATPATWVVVLVVAAALWWVLPLPTRPVTWLLLTGSTIALGMRAFRFRVRNTVAPKVAMNRERDWAEHVAIREGAKDSVMVGSEDVQSPRDGQRIGWAAGIEFAKGAKGASDVVNGLRTYVATTYGVGPRDILWEVNPKNDREARLVVIDAPNGNALDEDHFFTGVTDFDPATGIFTHGIRADWTPAHLRLFKPNYGAFHGHFSGGTGGGKTRGIDVGLRLSTQHGVVVPIIIDLGGSEFVNWARHVPLYIGKRDDGDEELSALAALQVLMNINALVQYRQRKLGQLRRAYAALENPLGDEPEAYPVDGDRPVIWTIFDEWQFASANYKVKAATTELQNRFTPGGERRTISEAIVQETKLNLTQARKAVMPLWIAGQALGLTEGFAGLSSIRNQCQQGNMVAYRNTAEGGQQAFGGGMSVDPSTIQAGKSGACFLSSPAESRDAMVRTFWAKNATQFDGLIDIPQLPGDEMAILCRGIDDNGELILPRSKAAAAETAVHIPVQRPDLHAVSTVEEKPGGRVASDLKIQMVEWAVQQERPVRRAEFVSEFARGFEGSRGVARKTDVDAALAELKEAGHMQADGRGVYTVVKEVAA